GRLGGCGCVPLQGVSVAAVALDGHLPVPARQLRVEAGDVLLEVLGGAGEHHQGGDLFVVEDESPGGLETDATGCSGDECCLTHRRPPQGAGGTRPSSDRSWWSP